MKILYIAEDGTSFENEWDCETYEDMLNHPEIKNIIFYDKNDCPYHINENLFDDNIYNNCEKVLIYNEKDYKAFQWLAQEAGWCEFQDQINSSGFWIRHTKESMQIEGSWERIQ